MDAIFMAKKKRYDCISLLCFSCYCPSFLSCPLFSSLCARYDTNVTFNMLLFFCLLILSGERDDEDEDADDAAEENSGGVLPTVRNSNSNRKLRLI